MELVEFDVPFVPALLLEAGVEFVVVLEVVSLAYV